MAETQRQPVPRDDGGEADTGLAFLSFARRCVLKKLEGLDDEQLRRPVVSSGTSLLGLVQHLADAERCWFHVHVAGRDVGELTFSMDVGDRTTDAVVDDYLASIAVSDEILAGIDDWDQRMALDVDDQRLSVRWAVAHMTGETTRHAGHADVLRELIDGTTGR